MLRRFLLTIAAFAVFFPLNAPASRAYCGDGSLEADRGEQCDDGNFAERDGCSSYCLFEDLTPPEVARVSIADKAEGIPAALATITLVFSEPMAPQSVTPGNITVEHHARPLAIELVLGSDQKTVTVYLKEPLASASDHSIHVKNVRDAAENIISDEFIRVFYTAARIDVTPPYVAAEPPEGTYSYPQQVRLVPYLSQDERGPGFQDETAIVHYTLDGSVPDANSLVFKDPLAIEKHTTVRFFGIDGAGNVSASREQVYAFACQERAGAKRTSPYPICTIQECERGFALRYNTCTADQQGAADAEDYQSNAFTAPLFASDAPVTVSGKSAIEIVHQHKGVIPRPILFKNLKGGTEIRFERNTKIIDDAGRAFAGFLTTPVTRFTKDFPANFGYSFKSILEFKSPDGRHLTFDPPYQITIPLGDRLEDGEPVTVFTFNSENEQYQPIDAASVQVDAVARTVTVLSRETDIFFVAQSGVKFTQAAFMDMDSHWAKNYAEALYRRGIVKGRAKGIYDPDGLLNRAEFTKIALEAIGADVPSEEELTDTYFPDVSLYAWYAPYVAAAKERGLISGYADGLFRPDQPINRAEAIKILMAAFGFSLSDAAEFNAEEAYPDVAAGSWYYPFINFAIKHSLLSGIRTPSGKILPDFGPGRPMTRGEMAELAIKAIELHDKTGK